MKYALSLILAWNLMAAPPQAAQAPAPAPAASQPAQKIKKKGGKKKWIVVGAVAGGAVVALALVAKRFGNEGVRIFP